MSRLGNGIGDITVMQSPLASLHDLIGGREQALWKSDADGVGSAFVDNQLKHGRLLDRQFTRRDSAQKFRNIGSKLPKDRIDVRPVDKPPASTYSRASNTAGRRCSRHNLAIKSV
jgi:hypothetical protein